MRVLTNQYTIKQLTGELFKYTLSYARPEFSGEKKLKSYDDKLKNSISRSRTTVFEYSICNTFDYFVTLTLDGSKYKRDDLTKFIKDLSQMIRNNRKKFKNDIQYLLIPELHKDGQNWHMHGLIKGVTEKQLEEFKSSDPIPGRLKDLIKSGRKIYNWPEYQKKFGYVTVEPIINQEAISKYITKYIAKSFYSQRSVSQKHKKLYYASWGLKKAELIKKGTLPSSIRVEPDFKNKYMETKILNLNEFIILNNSIFNEEN